VNLLWRCLKSRGKSKDFNGSGKIIGSCNINSRAVTPCYNCRPHGSLDSGPRGISLDGFLKGKTEVLPFKILPSFWLLISSKSGKPSGSVHDLIMNRWNNVEANELLVEHGLDS